MTEYDDLIYRERPVSRKHKPMPIENRAAQFAPFAALTGYEESIRQTAQQAADQFDERGRKVSQIETAEDVY